MSKTKINYILYGILGLAILFIAYWGINFLKGSSIFNKNYTYYVFYDRVEGLNASSPVTINGYTIGQVTKIELMHKQNNQLKVTIEISKEFLLPDSTVAKITSIDLLGSKGVELIFNNNTTSFHSPNDVLLGEVEQSLKDQVSLQMLPIKNQAEKLMKELSKAVEIITYIFNEDTRYNLEKSFESIKTTLSYIEHSTYSLDTLLSYESKKISKIISNVEFITSSLRNNQSKIENIINNISTFSDTLAAINISKIIIEANSVIAKFNNIVDKIDKGEGTLGQLINDDKFIRELENSAVSLDKLLNDLRLNPKKYVNFSLMNIGRTVNVSDESQLSPKDIKALEKKKKKEEKEKQKNLNKEEQQNNKKNTNDDTSLYFMIQVKSATNPILLNSNELKDYDNVVEMYINNRYKYFLFNYKDPIQTEYYLMLLKEDFPDAFPVAFVNNEQISYSKALSLMAVNN